MSEQDINQAGSDDLTPGENNQDGDNLNPDDIDNQDELDSLLEAIDKKSEPDDKDKTLPEGKDKGDNGFFKKVGHYTFKTEEEYDAFVKKTYGEVSNLSGELKRAKQAAIDNPSKQADIDVEKLRMRIKAEDFFEDTPDALNYREEMAAFLRSGKAKDAKGRPSLQIAYEKALRADGKEPQAAEAVTTEKDNVKRIMRSGGGEGGHGAGSVYESDNDVKSVSDFADAAIAKKF